MTKNIQKRDTSSAEVVTFHYIHRARYLIRAVDGRLSKIVIFRRSMDSISKF